MTVERVMLLLENKGYRANFVEREGDCFVAYLRNRRGINDQALMKRFERTRLEVVKYGHCVVNGHYLKLRERA